MSLLPPTITAELVQLLSALQSPENNVRSKAEEVLYTSWVAIRPEVLLMGFVEQIQNSSDGAVCSIPFSLFSSFSSSKENFSLSCG